MHLNPILRAYQTNRNINVQARFRSLPQNNEITYTRPKNHQYTGNAATDLAYASMFDNQIAKDLKLMGLI